MILSGPEIRKQIDSGRITIDPFQEKNMNPVSVDLTLGSEVAVYRHQVATSAYAAQGEFASWHGTDDHNGVSNGSQLFPYRSVHPLDTKKEPAVRRYTIDPVNGWLLRPGIGYLMHTAERVHTDFYVPILDGKSSTGRLFIKIHETAGFGDPGFNGQYTLEVTVVFPVIVYAGMRICQIRFHEIQGEVASYTSHKSNYVGALAEGPVASRAYKMFEVKP